MKRNYGKEARKWFVIESKSFEIQADGVGKKERVCIRERSKGFVFWIRFGKEGLRCLLEGVESCCRRDPERS